MCLIAWIKKLRHPKRSPQFRSAFISHAEAMEDRKQELAQLKRLQSSAPGSKPETPARPPKNWIDPAKERRFDEVRERLGLSPTTEPASPAFRSRFMCPMAKQWKTTNRLAVLSQLQLSKPPSPPDASLRNPYARLRALLNPGYESGDGSMDGAQLVDGQWWHPRFGCDSLQYVVDNAEIAVTPPKPQPSGGRLFINGIEQPKPSGTASLLEMVDYAIAVERWEDEAKGAVLAVAQWLRSRSCHDAAIRLEIEAGV